MRFRFVLAWMTLIAIPAFAGQPNMLISAPHGGEAYIDGQPQQLIYSGKTKFKSLFVELSRDGGLTWETIGTINNKVKDIAKRNQIVWTVKGNPSTNCEVRMTGQLGSVKKPKKYSITSGHFVIASGTTPDGNLLTGPTGPEGNLGPIGPQGAQGIQGIAGPIGPTGLQGIVGPVGPQGETGDVGAVGPQGPQGVQGIPGVAGLTGPQGDVGSMGPAGPQGAQGPAGPQGPQGIAGPAGTDGTDGAVGPAGSAGPAGPQGVAGTNGAQGPAGPAGAQGVAGPTGPQGPTGANGAVGPAGPAGPQGPAGPAGPAGAQGPIGPNGSPTVSYISTANLNGLTVTYDGSKHSANFVYSDPNIRGPGNVNGRSRIFLQFSTTGSTAGIVSTSYSNLQNGQVTIFISSQNYAINAATDGVDITIINSAP